MIFLISQNTHTSISKVLLCRLSEKSINNLAEVTQLALT